MNYFTMSLPRDMIKLRLAGSKDCSRDGLGIIGGLCLIAQLEEKLPPAINIFPSLCG